MDLGEDADERQVLGSARKQSGGEQTKSERCRYARNIFRIVHGYCHSNPSSRDSINVLIKEFPRYFRRHVGFPFSLLRVLLSQTQDCQGTEIDSSLRFVNLTQHVYTYQDETKYRDKIHLDFV